MVRLFPGEAIFLVFFLNIQVISFLVVCECENGRKRIALGNPTRPRRQYQRESIFALPNPLEAPSTPRTDTLLGAFSKRWKRHQAKGKQKAIF